MSAVHLRVSVPLAILVAATAACGDMGRRELPDVLLISLDTLRADRISCYGYERETTPVLDRLAAEGVRFRAAHAPASNTKPSHMSVFTGLDPRAHGIQPHVAAEGLSIRTLSPDFPTLAEVLSSAGYRTASFSDGGALPRKVGFERGVDHFVAAQEPPDVKLARIEEWLAEQEPGRPVFTLYHTYSIHSPYVAPAEFYGRWSDPAYDGPLRAASDAWRAFIAIDGREHTESRTRPEFMLKGRENVSPEDARFLSDLYDEGIAYTDTLLDDLLRAWDAARDLENTLVVVFSDHGEEFLEHGGLGHKRGLHGELVRVPWIVRGPGVGRGVVERHVSLIDLMPTLLEHLELGAPRMQGRSLAALLTDPARDARSEPVFAEDRAAAHLCQSVFHEDLHLIRSRWEGEELVQLFDWAADPYERHDLAAERPQDVTRLLELLDRRVERATNLGDSAVEAGATRVSAEDAAHLELLGYAGE